MEVTGTGDDDPHLQTRNLLQIVIYNICYMRGLFNEEYFSDTLFPALEMKIKKLMPIDVESRRLIDWTEKGVFDALQKKYLKTLLFCICENEKGLMIEEYSFSFRYPNTSTSQLAMIMSRTGSANSAEVTAHQMRGSTCKMIRTLVSLMVTLEPIPDDRTILMKFLYYDDLTPEDYEPPFFKCCTDNEVIDQWKKNPLKVKMGHVNSKHLMLAVKVRSVLDPCGDKSVDGDDGMSVDNESSHDDFSDPWVHASKLDHIVVSNDDTHVEELIAQVKDWICSRKFGRLRVSDVLSNFTDIPTEILEDIMKRLLKCGVLSRESKDVYAVNQAAGPKTLHLEEEVVMQNVSPTEQDKHNRSNLIYMKALYHVLPMDYVTTSQLQEKLDGEANQNTVRKLIDKMVDDGYVKNSANQEPGKAVIHSKFTYRKLVEIKKILQSKGSNYMGTHSMGSEVLGPRIKRTLASDDLKSSRAKRLRKANLGSECAAGRIMCINPEPTLHYWNLDSGATNHLTGELSWLKNQRDAPDDKPEMFNAAHVQVNINVMGDILSKRLRLFDVYHSNDLHKKELYISVGQLTDLGYHIQIVNGGCSIHLPNNFNHIVGRGSIDHITNAYLLRFFNDSLLQRSKTCKEPDKEVPGETDEYPVAKGEWALDSGSPYHCCNDISLFTAHWNIDKKTLTLAGRGKVDCEKEGHVALPELQLNNVYFAPESSNLISVKLLDATGYKFFFSGDACHITYREEETLAGLAHKDGGNKNYYVEFLYSK